MAKKKTLTKDEKIALERAQLIEQYNKENAGVSRLENEPATEDDVNAAKKAYEDAQTAFNSQTYVIADKPNALRVAKFLKNWNEKYAVWEKDQWVGVVKFDSLIADYIGKLEAEETDLVVDYNTLIYLDVLMMRPAGRGLESAEEMESMNEEYNKILECVDDRKNEVFEQQRKIRQLQDVWGAATCGFKIHYLTEDEIAEYEQSTVLGVEGESEKK